jgi:hypothetical protein
MPLPKLAVPVLAVVAVFAATPTSGHAQSAYSYPWCAVYPRAIGGYACYYRTYELCMNTTRGIGGYCMQSPFYRGPEAGSPSTSRRQRHGRHA